MSQRSVGDEIKERVPRIIVNLAMVLFFWFVSLVAPKFVEGIKVPGINIPPYDDAGWLIWASAMMMGIIFLLRASSDIIVLADIGAEIVVRRIGVREEKPLKRVARDVVYILLTILLAAAAMPFAISIPQFGGLMAATVSFIALGIFLILMYDIGRIIYKVVEEKTKILANWLAGLAERASREDQNDK